MEDKFEPHERRLVALWEKMVRSIGIHTVNVLMARAIYETSQKHPELALIRHDDSGIRFEAMERASAGRSEREVADAFADLTEELLVILARLLGREVAERLASALETPALTEPAGEAGKAP
ncbi:MAG: hypothetical protein K6V36_06300 [Anaerolineae bacterium]|nr:hypothetical protein [Anaerolineae bacterium]